MAADFTPSLEDYSGVRPFRFWCQKVLPLVYDDSLSYYELLNKVVDYLNETIKDVAAAEGNIEDLLTAYNQLQEYVNDYFDNLDVQNEIDNKLDNMVTDGTLGALVDDKLDSMTNDGTISNMVDNKVDSLVDNGTVGAMVDNKLDTMAVDGTISGIINNLIGNTLNPVVVNTTNDMTDVNTTYVLASNGHIYQYSGSAFYDTGLVYGGSIGNVVTYTGILSGSENLNDLNPQTIYIAASSTLVNAPTTDTGFVYTYGGSGQDTRTQMYVRASDGKTWYRRKTYNGAWQSWSSGSVFYNGLITSGGDLNSFTPQSVYLVIPNNTSNVPTTEAGYCLTLGDWGGSWFQMYIENGNGKTWYRRHTAGGEWKAWNSDYIRFGGTLADGRDLNDIETESVYLTVEPLNHANLPSRDAGFVHTIGSGTNAYQLYIVFINGGMYYRRRNYLGQWLEWYNLNDGNTGNAKAHLLSVGNSILTGSVWLNGVYDHLSAYGNAPYSVVADAISIPRSNVTHHLISATGFVYDAGEGSFLDKIKSIDLASYDAVLTHFYVPDMNSGNAIGTANSTAGDGTLAGAVVELLNYIDTSNPMCHLILCSLVPVSTTIYGDNVFTGRYPNGANISELDTVMHTLADKYHFTYIDFQDWKNSYNWHSFTDGLNVHANNENIYRLMGAYLGGRASREINF